MIVSILRISFVLMIGALVISCSTPEQLEDLYRPDLSEIGELRISKLQVTETELNTMRADKDTDPVALGRMYGKLGMMYHAYKSNDGALHYYTKAASMEPSNFIWPYYQAQIHRELNDYETAHGLFETALELKPNFPPTILNLAEYYRQRNDLVKAAQYFRQSLELRDADAFAITGLAQIYVAQKDYQSAKQQIDKALELQPKSSRVHYVAAMAARGLGDIEKAEFHLAEREKLSQDIAMLDRLMAAISDMAADGKAAFNEGMKVLETGDMEGARLHFQNAVDAEPNEAEFRLRLAWTMIHTGDKEGALQQYLAALPHRPGNTEIHYNMGGLYLETEDPERAIQHYDKVIELDPDYGDAHRKLADLYRLNGEYEKAVNHYKQMIRLDGNDPESRFGYALMHARLGRLSNARNSLEESIKLMPNQPAFRQALARVLSTQKSNGKKEGVRAMELIQPYMDDDADIALSATAAMACAQAGRFDLAINWQKRGLKLAQNQGASTDFLQANLNRYQSRKTAEKPWSDQDPIFKVRTYGR